MQRISLFTILTFFFSMCLFSCIFSYPIFCKTTNLTRENAFQINTYHETELSPSFSDTKRLLDLPWKDINVLLEFDTPFEIILPLHDTSFFAIRTGGKNHADIEPQTTDDLETINSLNKSNEQWTLTNAIVKLNNSTFLPACLSTYAHGYKTTNLSSNGHFCLHFKGSKTHGTNLEDEILQKIVNKSRAFARKIINEN